MNKMNKKGSIFDLIFIVGVSLFFGIIVLVGLKVLSGFTTEISTMSDMPTEAITSSNQLIGVYTGAMDYSMLFIVFGFAIAAFIMASLVRVHPIFIPFYLITLLIVIIIAGVASNVYQTMAAEPLLVAEASQLEIIGSILTYLPLIVGILGTILMIVMYKLWDNTRI